MTGAEKLRLQQLIHKQKTIPLNSLELLEPLRLTKKKNEMEANPKASAARKR